MLYLTAEKFMYGFVSALRTQTALAFKEALRGIDVLVIDDLQFLQGKSTQAEFCHTLNALIDAGRQVVIAADRPPTDLESLDDRVRSRLAGGLVVEMGPLGEELRLEILKTRVTAARHASSRASTCRCRCSTYIAKTVTHNGRDLEGALNRLLAHNKLTGQPVTLEMAEREVRDLIRPQEPKRVKIEDIQRVVARQYNVSRADLLSSRRTANVVRPRQVAMYLAKTLTLALAAGDRPPVRRPRPHHRAARGAQDRGPGRQRHGAGRGDRDPEAAVAGIAGVDLCAPACKASSRRSGPRLVAAAPAEPSGGKAGPLSRRTLATFARGRATFDAVETGVRHEGHRRARRTAEVAGPRASRGRAAQHHSDPRQRADQGRRAASSASRPPISISR